MKKKKNNKDVKCSKWIKFIVCTFLLIIISGILLPPFFYHSLHAPSIEEKQYFIFPPKGALITIRRKSILPFCGRNNITAKFVWPENIKFSEWYKQEFAKISPSKLKISESAAEAQINLPGGGYVLIEISLVKQILHYNVIFVN